MVRRRAEEQWAKSTASSGRCRPQTLQRFLSLVFNSMLPACHSDLRSVPVIRTAFKAGPKQQSCLRGGRCRGGVMERGGGAHEPMRCTFKLTWGRYIFTFLLTLPGLIAQGDGGGGGGWEFCRSRLCFFFFNPLHKFLVPVTPRLQSVLREVILVNDGPRVSGALPQEVLKMADWSPGLHEHLPTPDSSAACRLISICVHVTPVARRDPISLKIFVIFKSALGNP